jgi:GAF domain-containing protein
LISVSHAKTSIFSDHPAYREMGLETYIGAPLKDNEGEQLGTLNFSASEKRELGFDAEHEAFVQKMADWLSSELIHQDDYVKA